MRGILCIDKPMEHTSFDVVARLRGILGMRRLGHTGTLDPMATGVLPVLVGNATRALDLLPDERKCYTATAQLGLATDTEDITGQVLQRAPFQVEEAALGEALSRFQGSYLQTPPMYSAIKMDGKRLYELARAGKSVERPQREVMIEEITLHSFDRESGLFSFSALVSKGTYIRTLCVDIAQSLGTIATMTALQRTAACGFSLGDAYTLEQVEAAARAGEAESLLLPLERLFEGLPRVVLSPAQTRMFTNGVPILKERVTCAAQSGRVTFYEEDGTFLGLGNTAPEQDVFFGVKQFPKEVPA